MVESILLKCLLLIVLSIAANVTVVVSIVVKRTISQIENHGTIESSLRSNRINKIHAVRANEETQRS